MFWLFRWILQTDALQYYHCTRLIFHQSLHQLTNAYSLQQRSMFLSRIFLSVWFFSGAKYHGAMINGNEKSGLRLSRTRNFDLYPDIIYAPYLNLQFLHQRQTAVIQSVYTLDEMFLSWDGQGYLFYREKRKLTRCLKRKCTLRLDIAYNIIND